jgi:hypothetical protein
VRVDAQAVQEDGDPLRVQDAGGHDRHGSRARRFWEARGFAEVCTGDAGGWWFVVLGRPAGATWPTAA